MQARKGSLAFSKKNNYSDNESHSLLQVDESFPGKKSDEFK